MIARLMGRRVSGDAERRLVWGGDARGLSTPLPSRECVCLYFPSQHTTNPLHLMSHTYPTTTCSKATRRRLWGKYGSSSA